ncbi:hypothetical protein [Acidovorax bellezanensis]|uniref:hypothetical protein n=1 Tax=Acidovorax bellezanensis TaxID=2976702 RepID=UPI0038CD12C4
MVVGAVTVLVWQHYQWFKLYEMVPGFGLATLAILAVSRLDAPPSARLQAIHAEVDEEIRLHGG